MTSSPSIKALCACSASVQCALPPKNGRFLLIKLTNRGFYESGGGGGGGGEVRQ